MRDLPGFMVVMIIGAAVGFVARLLYPGPNTPRGFLLTTVLGVVGAIVATFFARDLGFADKNQLADPISMIFGAMIVLFIWNRLAVRRIVRDPGMHHPNLMR